MNRQQFIGYIKSPEKLNSESLLQLENLVKEYPFCQTADILLALNLYLEKNIKFNDQLKVASAYAADRKVLKHLLNTVQKFNHLNVIEPKNDLNESVIKPNITTVPEAISSEERTLADLINQLKSEVNSYMMQASERKSDQQIILLHSLAEKLEKIIGSDIKPVVPVEKKKGAGRSSAGEYSLDHIEELPVRKKNQLANAELIDKFIREEPKIVPKPTFFDPVDSAKHSLEDSESVVSETLAEIYYKQGNLSKAIKIYKKLSLVNPQKSSYFAAQIEKIKKEIK